MAPRAPHRTPASVTELLVAPRMARSHSGGVMDGKLERPVRTGGWTSRYSLTIAGQHAQFLVTSRGLRSTNTVTGRPLFERALRE